MTTLGKISDITIETVPLSLTLRYMLYSNRNTKMASTLPASFASAYEAEWPQLLSEEEVAEADKSYSTLEYDYSRKNK